MIELDRTLLAAFGGEMLEHAEACEQVLARASAQPVYEEDFKQLLRSMHSIKALARVVASTGLEKLAHLAESLLVAVRRQYGIWQDRVTIAHGGRQGPDAFVREQHTLERRQIVEQL